MFGAERSKRSDDTQRRVVEALRHAMGATIRVGLDDPDVIEVMVNPDGRIWFDRIGQGREPTDQALSPADAESILRLLADHARVVVTDEGPLVSASLPLTLEALGRSDPSAEMTRMRT